MRDRGYQPKGTPLGDTLPKAPKGGTGQSHVRCTTHHRACDCREALFREVVEALDNLVLALELPGDHDEVAQALPRARAALRKYRKASGNRQGMLDSW